MFVCPLKCLYYESGVISVGNDAREEVQETNFKKRNVDAPLRAICTWDGRSSRPKTASDSFRGTFLIWGKFCDRAAVETKQQNTLACRRF